jgi:hypothetical protein
MSAFVRLAVIATALVALAACAPPGPKEIAYPSWGFAASFPMTPTVTDTPASPRDGQPRTFQSELSEPGLTLVVAASAVPPKKTVDQILDETPNAMAAGAEAALKSEVNVSTGKVPGREFLIVKAGELTQRARIFVAGGRLYQVVGASSKGPNDPDVTAFLNSFRLL